MYGSSRSITYTDYLFQPDDFLKFPGSFKKAFMADVTAFISPCAEAISVEITSIVRDPDRKQIESFLRRDLRFSVEVFMRQQYVNSLGTEKIG